MSYDFSRLLGPSTYAAAGVLASIPASGVLYVRCRAGSAVEKLDWLLKADRNHSYQFFRSHQLPGYLASIAISGWLNTETILIQGLTYTGATSTTTWSTRGISIAGTDEADATLLQKAINGGALVTLASVAAADTVTINGTAFTAHATTTTAALRQFSIAGTNTQDAAELVTCVNDVTYGASGVTATQGAATGEVLFATTANHNTYPTVTSSNGTRLAVSSIGDPYLECDRTTTTLYLKWRASLVDRSGSLAPSFFTAKTGTATSHAAFTDTLLTTLEADGAQVTGKTDNSTTAGTIYTQTLNGAEEGYLQVTNADGSNACVTSVAAYRIPFA